MFLLCCFKALLAAKLFSKMACVLAKMDLTVFPSLEDIIQALGKQVSPVLSDRHRLRGFPTYSQSSGQCSLMGASSVPVLHTKKSHHGLEDISRPLKASHS